MTRIKAPAPTALHRRRHGPQRRAAPARQGGRAREQRQGEGRRERRLRLPVALRRSRPLDRRRHRRHVALIAVRPPHRRGRPLRRCVRDAEGDVPSRLHDLRRRCDAGPARRDRALRRDPEGRRREAVRHRRREDGDRADVVRRQRRPEGGQRGAVQGPSTATGSISVASPTSPRSSRASWRGRRRRSSRSGRPARPTTSTSRRTFRAQRASPARASWRRGSPRAYRSASTSARRRTSMSRAGADTTGRRSPTTPTSTSTYGFWMGDMPHWVHLSPETCRGIETLLHNRPAYPNAFTADAIQTLSHEMMHALGVDNEAEAECLGMQVSAVLARGARRARSTTPSGWRSSTSRTTGEAAAGVHRQEAVPRERGLGPPRGRELPALARRLSRSCRTSRDRRKCPCYMDSGGSRVTIAAVSRAPRTLAPCCMQSTCACTLEIIARSAVLIPVPRLPI